MSHSESRIDCPNSACKHPQNLVGEQVCATCQTPLIYRYLWATGTVAERQIGERVVDRYQVIAPHIWLDTKPGLPPTTVELLPDETLPYLYLYPYRLHVPEIFGVIQTADPDGFVFLLENAPLDDQGNLYPAIADVWEQTAAHRQLYWLWQILQLWQPLLEQGVATSLLMSNNLRVQGWRVQLRELVRDEGEGMGYESPTSAESFPAPSLKDLGRCWAEWVLAAQAPVMRPLQELCDRMQAGAEWAEITTRLNQLLMEQTAQLPLRLQVYGATDPGPEREHNEDACYPLTASQPEEDLLPYLAIVCDGIGGHEGGEVASQLAVQTLKLQMRALLAEVAEQEELVPPDVLASQIEASIRVVNNLIASQNDAQNREARRRMGTTLVMALQLPQRVKTASGSEFGNTHELYLAHVGDSRAYWITPDYCHLLTVDDDVAVREAKLGRSLYREALIRPDAGALTQALGTRDAEFLRPTVQRFLLDEDGLLLLCSDGLSDNSLVERSWAEYSNEVFKRTMSLEKAVQAWIELANRKNGYDNTSVVLLQCQVTPPKKIILPGESLVAPPESELSEASRVLLYPDAEETETAPNTQEPVTTRKASKRWLSIVGFLVLLLLGVTIGTIALRQLNPTVQPSPEASPEVPPTSP
jgi:protein phosphatase